MDQPETPLDLASQYVADGEARCARLTDMLENMENRSSPEAIQATERLLAVLDQTLVLLRHYVQEEQTHFTSGTTA